MRLSRLMHSHYDNLKVSRDAPAEVIRAAYKSLSQKYHPDRHADSEEANRIMRLLNAAYDVLRDPEKRAEHDQWIVAQEKREADQKQRQATQQRQAYRAAQAQQQRQAAQRQQAQRPAPPPAASEPEPAAEQPARTRKPRRSWRDAPPNSGPATPLPKLGSFALYLGIGALIVVLLSDWSGDNAAGRGVPAAATASTLSSSVPPSASSLTRTVAPGSTRDSKYIRPTLTPRGLPWPTRSGYLPGYPVLNDSGLSTLTVDNSASPSDVMVKLVSVEGNTPLPVRTSYVRGGTSFTMDEISPGSYDLRYQSLDTGELFRSERFELAELRESGGTSANRNVFRLYGVPGGTSRSVPISERDFP
ncbi:J domain-containing protein [Cupriavidus sp. SW-Y-13]|uniref:J domain-containing protein n=1 Tax=Cupriavidus sp. SW-Y-13 TaxID=2653854 RepID=UPI001F402567|nr:J domain-containing protein [Cupriavidus sp. SW-Y-13]